VIDSASDWHEAFRLQCQSLARRSKWVDFTFYKMKATAAAAK